MDAQQERKSSGLCDGLLAKNFGLRKELDITELAILIVFVLSFGLALGFYFPLVITMITNAAVREKFTLTTSSIVFLFVLLVVFIQTLDQPNQDNRHTSKAERDRQGDMSDTVSNPKGNHVDEEKMEDRYRTALEENQRLRSENVKYDQDHKDWMQEKSNLLAELDAVRKCAKMYRGVLHDIDRF